MKKLMLLALLTIAATRIANAGDILVGSPLISGDLTKYANREQTAHAALSSPQLAAIAAWLVQHESGWSGMMTEASMEPTELQVNLKHSDGTKTSISIVAQAGGGHYLLLTGPCNMAYRSLGGLVKFWAAVRPVSAQELAAFERLAGAP